ELARVGQDQPLGQGLQQLPEPFVAGGGLDDRLEGPQPVEAAADAFDVATSQPLAADEVALLVERFDWDSLLVEVDADEVHGVLLVWKEGQLLQPTATDLPRTQGHQNRLRPPSP